jgi:hypothetical protein
MKARLLTELRTNREEIRARQAKMDPNLREIIAKMRAW